MLPPKNGKPITFKPTQQLRERTEDCADSAGLSLSDYVRKAVEEYNKKFPHFDSTHKNDTVSKPQYTEKILSEIEEYELHDKKMKQQSKSTMVQTFQKGGGKK